MRIGDERHLTETTVVVSASQEKIRSLFLFFIISVCITAFFISHEDDDRQKKLEVQITSRKSKLMVVAVVIELQEEVRGSRVRNSYFSCYDVDDAIITASDEDGEDGDDAGGSR